MAAAPSTESAEDALRPAQFAELIPLVRRIVAARVSDQATADDLVQETLARVLAAADRVEPGMLEPYAIVTSRNVVASHWRDRGRQQRNQHRVVDLRPPDAPDEALLAREEQGAVAEALTRLSDRERETLLAHEVSGQDTRSLAEELGSTAGAVAAQLNRTRARLRVEYLLAVERVEPPTERCRPVLLAISSADRRRQREVDAGAPPAGVRPVRAAERAAAGPRADRGGRGPRPRPGRRRRRRRPPGRPRGGGPARLLADRADRRSPPPSPRWPATSCGSPSSGEVVIEILEEPRPGIRIVARDAGPGHPRRRPGAAGRLQHLPAAWASDCPEPGG